jgi:hypothetical protein
MKTTHALGFLFLGFGLTMIPRVAPGWFPVDAINGSSGRELWVQLMSWTLFAIGGYHFLKQLLAMTATLLEYDHARAKAAAAAPRQPVFARALARLNPPVVAAAGELELLEFTPEWLAERRVA